MTSPPRKVCPVCGSVELRAKPFGYRFESKWLGGFECCECGIIFIHPRPSAGQLARLYSKEYFEGDFRCGHEGNYFEAATRGTLVDTSLLDRILVLVPRGRFLEVGCAGGAFLNAAKKSGYEVAGVEYSGDAASFAREQFGLDVKTGDLLGAGYPTQHFDVVFMGDVLEHLPDPVSTMREIHRILTPSGILVLLCPTQTNTLFSRIGFFLYHFIGRNATVNLPPYHLFEYRPGSMKGLVVRNGFSVVRSSSSIMNPREIALRGSALQNLGKKMFHYPNYLITRLVGVFGDRIELIARKTESELR